MKIRKLLKIMVVMGILLIMCSICLFGCDKNNQPNNDKDKNIVIIGKENVEKYHAKLYIPEKNWFKKEFLDNNLTGGMIVEGEPDEYGIPTVDQIPNTYPKKRNYIINNKEEFDSIFSSFAAEIDFDAQMLVLLIETSINPNPDYIKALTIDNKLLQSTYIFLD